MDILRGITTLWKSVKKAEQSFASRSSAPALNVSVPVKDAEYARKDKYRRRKQHQYGEVEAARSRLCLGRILYRLLAHRALSERGLE
jgi:hypothetical protein